MSELKNPGLDMPTNLIFEEIPPLKEFLAHGGVPGVEYLFVAAENMPKAQNDGWSQIIGVPFFQVGTVGTALMARGTAVKHSAAQPGTSLCVVFADDKVTAATKTGPTVVVAAQTTSQGPKISRQPTSTELLATK